MQRMGKAEACPVVVVGINPDMASQLLDDELADGEAQSATLGQLVELLKAVEHLVVLIGGDTTARIGHTEEGLLVA